MSFLKIDFNENEDNKYGIVSITFYPISNPSGDSYKINGSVYINMRNIQSIEVISVDNNVNFIAILLQNASYVITIKKKYLEHFLKFIDTHY